MVRGLRQTNFLSSIPGKKFPWNKILEPFAKALLKKEKKNAVVNIVFCDDKMQRELNRDYRNLNCVTDVLSFVWNEPDLLGEIYIAEGQVKRQAAAYGCSYCGELKRVLTHGLLHLCGYDHCSKTERKIMREKEAFYLGKD